MHIRRFEPRDYDAVVNVILPIQRDEFGFDVTVDHQPDLRIIPEFYQRDLGDFWVAEADGKIVGTIGLVDIGDGLAALRKMFVAAEWRGREHGIAAKLLGLLLATARERGIRAAYLGTTDRFLAAHRFYEKNGFAEVARSDLPASFPVVFIDTKFYVHRLDA
ncbi:GNAT family N-acetyltransferase [Aminobacter aminovorans]|uniref:N-acetylglutamate synthase-like GNAT family acetyltransferase n=1 Tax=Aminobacter aminovorans TaxID=83263 RepID=A0AAC9ARK8_AMIAI|nr:GNAT family N-acetyltransferase [Aminobacter aminovorans]AMS42256.1 hypothetical protein AA2016_3334 [Aminobacter aminovorans]MBB3709154.1 N-acetylglutamate synthase-like GNAT family acetyltransferase [Aminobacter aminovorans]